MTIRCLQKARKHLNNEYFHLYTNIAVLNKICGNYFKRKEKWQNILNIIKPLIRTSQCAIIACTTQSAAFSQWIVFRPVNSEPMNINDILTNISALMSFAYKRLTHTSSNTNIVGACLLLLVKSSIHDVHCIYKHALSLSSPSTWRIYTVQWSQGQQEINEELNELKW